MPQMPHRVRLKATADAVVAPIMIVAALTVIYRNVIADDRSTSRNTQNTLEVPTEPLSLDGVMMRGADDAEAVMIVFADFQCPYCGRFAREIQPTIERRYVVGGRLALAFRHLPLPVHAHAAQAAAISECAGRQGLFWEMHDRLFGTANLAGEDLRTMSAEVGVDLPLLDECLEDPAVSDTVKSSVAHAMALGIRGTPAFLLGKRLADGRVEVHRALSGVRPVEDFARELDLVLGDGGTSWRQWVRRLTW